MDDTSQCVKVAVNVRPLITPELLVGCTDCITVTPGEPQVQLGSHAFTFDYVFGSIGSPSHKIFDVCVAPLVEALFSGYNATVLAYGQTGSGKTYTMGTNYTGEHHIDGIIPKVMEMIFQKVETSSNDTEYLIRVSFIEIFKEEVFDLLDSSAINSSKVEGNSVVKPVAPPKNPIQIRETVSGGITLSGITEPEVQSKEEMAGFLARGALARATGSTNMNSQSSRSHAIFTIFVQQKRTANSVDSGGSDNDASESILGAKLHLVDLAGSERAKRTGADGLRLKEGIHINRGLLALGNVISALGDEKKRKEGAHVPYRDSKLTRLLQDSLGGNSKTVMIACVSPADTNAEETLNTLKYANRARNIQNKPIINRDPVAAQMQRMRSQLEQLQTELLFYRGEGTSFDEFQILKHKISVLEASNAELRRELLESKNSSEHFAQSALDSQVEKDRLLLKIELARAGKPWEEIDNGDDDQDTCLVTNYVKKIQELEAQLHQLRNINDSCASSGPMGRDLEGDGIQGHHIVSGNLNDDFDDEEKEREHSSLQNELGRELQELDKQLEQKEEEIKRVAKVDTSVLKQHYEKKLLDLEHEKKSLQKEIENLRSNLASISSSDDNAQKLKESYLQKLNVLEAQVAELKRKQEAQSQLLKQKQKSDDAAKRLQDEIQRIKAQKVQLQHKIKQESEQFRSWKVSREKEVLQLRKEGRRNEFEMHKLLALNQRQKMFLQRKTEEASMAAKRLKELLEAKKASFRDIGAGNGNGFTVQGAIQSIEHELEVMVRVHEVRRKYDRSMEERATWAKELAQLKEEAEVFKQKHIGLAHTQTLSPGARSSRIFALENMLKTSSKTLVDMASQLSAAAESEGNFNGKGRWNGVRSLPDAKSLLNFLFELVSSSRCQLRDMELAIDEKDSAIKELKEKVVELSSIFRKPVANTCDTQAKSIMLLEGPRIRSKKKLGDQMIPTDVVTFSDMDITDSDQSKTTDTEWEQSESEWELSGYNYSNHPLGRKRARKYEAHSKVMGSLPEEKNERSLKPEVCCSCSKNSLCKRKCECVNAGGFCGSSCGCLPGKCTNREAGNAKDDSQVGMERDNALVSLGTRLLESALGDKLIDSVEGDAHTRKPLADIGNSVNVGHKQQKQRKKWGKKSVVQLIPTAPLPPTSENNGSEARDWANETVSTDSIALKLPRAMTPMNTSNILRERNSNSTGTQNTKSKDPVNDTDTRSPLKQMRLKREKENKGA